MLQYVYLTNDFLTDYSDCTEIEQKSDRPYSMVLATIDNIDFAIPFRSNINHKYVVWTNRADNCGLDLSKSVVINNKTRYIDNTRTPQIRQDEHNSLKGKDHIVKQKLEGYIKDYKKALTKRHVPAKDLLCKYSALQYFHTELNIVTPVTTPTTTLAELNSAIREASASLDTRNIQDN